MPYRPEFERIASELAKLLHQKREKYGDSFNRSSEVLQILYPSGIGPSQYCHALALTRMIDKLFRIAASDRAEDDEDPFQDIAGYAILAMVKGGG